MNQRRSLRKSEQERERERGCFKRKTKRYGVGREKKRVRREVEKRRSLATRPPTHTLLSQEAEIIHTFTRVCRAKSSSSVERGPRAASIPRPSVSSAFRIYVEKRGGDEGSAKRREHKENGNKTRTNRETNRITFNTAMISAAIPCLGMSSSCRGTNCSREKWKAKMKKVKKQDNNAEKRCG